MAANHGSSGSSALSDAIARSTSGHDLDEELASAAFATIISGTADARDIRALLLALRAKGEGAGEIAGAVRALRDSMRRIAHADPAALVDTCGTGGGLTTINVSTAAAFVAAGAGVVIAKHGNRSYTSRSGSADVLEALGVVIEVEPDLAERILTDAGIVFLFAPTYHPAMRHVGPVRRELKVPTVMNLAGPLANPAGVQRQVVGVADPAKAPAVAQALLRLGVRHALVVHGEIGMDEISPVGRTAVWEVRDGRVHEWQFDPGPLGTNTLDGLEGGEPAENAAKILQLFDSPGNAAGALRAAVALNAAAAIYVAGLSDSLEGGVALALESMHTGKARAKLEELRKSGA